ncbi:MAG: DUF6498-containing protein, partial [Pseudomonadota bacterium]
MRAEASSFRFDLNDPSLWGVLAGNAFSIALAIADGWTLNDIMWVYWGQSIVIGVMNVARILTTRAPGVQTGQRIGTAVFFTVHYGIFHAVYAAFLSSASPPAALLQDGAWMLGAAVVGFLASHLFSFQHNKSRDFPDREQHADALERRSKNDRQVHRDNAGVWVGHEFVRVG